VATFSGFERELLERARVARLATAGAEGEPHVVPIVFAVDDGRFYTPLDDKPKQADRRRLKRVRNLLENPRVAVVVDEYDEDWTRLAWVLVRGTAAFVERGLEHDRGVRLLEAKYPQYGEMPLRERPIIVITPARVTSWRAAER
jgi:PPOX class probable F420-dependent enzyme